MRLPLLMLLVFWTWGILIYHIGVLPPPKTGQQNANATWFDKSIFGIHQLILEGGAYARGVKEGELTQNLLRQQERDLTGKLFSFLPPWSIRLLEIPLIRYFWGIDRFLDPWMLQEMYGVSQSAPREYDRLIDGYTRQLAYHGLHEVGQMMVDQTGDDSGCTVVAAPVGRAWVLGRNFDFEGGRLLDTEKIVKWVFPDEGAAFVSVIWAGMVGGVTGVNEHGIYLSINAAGSKDHRRYGLPTSLLLVKTLMAAKSASEALSILVNTPTFITDIFVLLDSNSGELYRIEKSPLRTEIAKLDGPSAVTNHLLADAFKDDPINAFRRDQLTSSVRYARASELLRSKAISTAKKASDLERPILKILRDKGEHLPFGNRRAIDSLIATHAVIYNSTERILFVNQGPALAGRFFGFDLKASFQSRKPVIARELPRDPEVPDDLVWRVRDSSEALHRAEKWIGRKLCPTAMKALQEARFRESAEYVKAKGNYEFTCENNKEAAIRDWKESLARHPAYPAQEKALQDALRKATQ